MTRDRWIEKIGAIVARVEAGEAPARIREIYVFGSFARGAPEPNDLDLIVIHDPAGEEVLAPLRQSVATYSYDEWDRRYKAELKFEAALRRVFRRGGERVDIRLEGSLEAALRVFVAVPACEIRPIWSEADRDWRAKVAGIAPDAAASRHPRDHYMDVKKTQGTLDDMERVAGLIAVGALTLERLRIDDIEPRLNGVFGHWLGHWTRCARLGAEVLKVLPWALWWLQEQGGEGPQMWERTEVRDVGRRFHVQVARIHPRNVHWRFRTEPRMERQCLIPRRLARGENWMYAFARGAELGGRGRDRSVSDRAKISTIGPADRLRRGPRPARIIRPV